MALTIVGVQTYDIRFPTSRTFAGSDAMNSDPNYSAAYATISRFCTLEPGDLILTGTPYGVGCFRTPPIYLEAEDIVVCEIDGIGRLENRAQSTVFMETPY